MIVTQQEFEYYTTKTKAINDELFNIAEELYRKALTGTANANDSRFLVLYARHEYLTGCAAALHADMLEKFVGKSPMKNRVFLKRMD